jgi:hypothetical protein
MIFDAVLMLYQMKALDLLARDSKIDAQIRESIPFKRPRAAEKAKEKRLKPSV